MRHIACNCEMFYWFLLQRPRYNIDAFTLGMMKRDEMITGSAYKQKVCRAVKIC